MLTFFKWNHKKNPIILSLQTLKKKKRYLESPIQIRSTYTNDVYVFYLTLVMPVFLNIIWDVVQSKAKKKKRMSNIRGTSFVLVT